MGPILSPIVIRSLAAIPPAPPAGDLLLYARARAGRILAEGCGPSGVEVTFQPALFGNRVMVVAPGTGTGVTSFGIGVTTAATLSHPALATTNLATSIYRTRCQTSTTAGNAAGIRHAAATMLRGNATARGGFFNHFRFCSGALTLTGCQQFVGLSSSTAALAGEPSTLTDALGIVKDSADTRFFFVRRTGSGTVQRVDLGQTWGANLTYDLILYSVPGGNDVGVVVRSFNNDGTAATLLDAVYNDNLPAATTFLGARFDVRNGAVAAAADGDLVRIYSESDF